MAFFSPLPTLALDAKPKSAVKELDANSCAIPAAGGISTIVLGGGLAGLACGYVLSAAGQKVTVFEGAPTVGGLSKTVSHNGFLFDLGGHRFLTKNKEIEKFVLELLQGQVLNVPRKSKIYLLNKYFDYPLKPVNAFFGLGLGTTTRIIADYCKERIKNSVATPSVVSLEDWVVNQFGRKMFDIYFRDYSEKVWGINCQQISQEWVSQRINGLSLWAAVKNAFCKLSGKNLLTLSDDFFYPTMGIGQLSDRLQAGIEKHNPVITSTRITAIRHDSARIAEVTAVNCSGKKILVGDEFISSIPLTQLVELLEPLPPPEVLKAARSLKYRDLIIVTLMLNREQVTDLTWMYLPGKDIPFGRIHEPKNWSPHMAPQGKTHIVAEFFCFKDDAIWSATDENLQAMTTEHLVQLGFINSAEVIDCRILRLQKAYPIFEVGYQEHFDTIMNYLKRFANLQVVGRGGKFKYFNMDHAMESGIAAANTIISKSVAAKQVQQTSRLALFPTPKFAAQLQN